MKAHRYAEIFPMLDDGALAELAKDIAANGLKEPVLTYRGEVLDGRNRLRACEIASVKPRFEMAKADNDEEALSLVMSLNLHRRHLNESQRAIVGARVLPFYETLAAERKAEEGRKAALRQQAERRAGVENGADRVGANLPPPTEAVQRTPHKARDDAAAAVNVSSRSVENAKKVIETAAPEVVAAVESGKLAVSAAIAAAELQPEEQREVARLVVSGEASSGAAAIREVKRPHVVNNSGENEWYTPSEYVEAARAVLGSFDLDPASCDLANRTVKAARFFDKHMNGLEQEWKGRVWMNPPYEKGLIDKFADKLATAVQAGDVTEAIVLVNNGTDTQWFKRMADVAAGLCLPSGRIRFISPTGEKGAPLQGQAIIYFGARFALFAKRFGGFGCVAKVVRHDSEDV